MNTTSGRPLAVVTGASSGIGHALAAEFARNGFDLVVAAEDEGISAAAAALRDLGATVESVRVDLAEYDGVERLYGVLRATGRPADAVAINAGVGVGGDFARDTDLRAELKLIDLNITSAVHLAKRVARDMVERGRGRILFTSSVAATMPGPFQAVYSASKAFLYSFSEALREELKDTGVTVTALLPGPTDTRFFERAGMLDTKVATGKKDDPAEVARDGFEALMAGKDHVVAGSLANKLMTGAARLAPETSKAAANRRLTEPGSAT
ncbi:SDR family NAD(P)-dependent oxidoreductase [Streptosporangium fragile]|uniref:SDR family NAD(P)-dependent oxidoreductase n=1 Tax=Streptosporangium fragile TaxID=46186 RepID=A0ABN3VS25_9ACTN